MIDFGKELEKHPVPSIGNGNISITAKCRFGTKCY